MCRLDFARLAANISLPDVAHAIRARQGEPVPTIGLGNVSIVHPRARAALRARLCPGGGDDSDPPFIRVIGHHSQVYGVMRCRPAEPARRVRVHLGEDGARRISWPKETCAGGDVVVGSCGEAPDGGRGVRLPLGVAAARSAAGAGLLCAMSPTP